MLKAEILPNHRINISSNAVSDSIRYESIKFIFPDNWNGYQKTAVFKYDDNIAVNIVLDGASELCVGDDECYIPHEVLKSPKFTVSVFGVSGDSLATTAQAIVKVVESGYEIGDKPSEPTPDEYAQITQIMSTTSEIAQSVRYDADNGVFKGEKGDRGPQGEQGIQGVKGDKGEKGDTPQIDQTYSPSSENAQSGLAVAKAISGKQDTIGTILTGSWNTKSFSFNSNFGSISLSGVPLYTSNVINENDKLVNKSYVDTAIASAITTTLNTEV